MHDDDFAAIDRFGPRDRHRDTLDSVACGAGSPFA
jgi:hypothetical protein